MFLICVSPELFKGKLPTQLGLGRSTAPPTNLTLHRSQIPHTIVLYYIILYYIIRKIERTPTMIYTAISARFTILYFKGEALDATVFRTRRNRRES